MQTVKPEPLEKYISEPVEVCIHGGADEDRAPWVKRKVKDVTMCPDQTHVRIYFDKHFFFAVPLTGTVVEKENEWTAYDDTANLFYVIRRV